MSTEITAVIAGRLRLAMDRVPDTDRFAEMLADARAALAKVAPPTPEQDNPLYYPLLFLVESAEPVARWLDEDDDAARATPELSNG